MYYVPFELAGMVRLCDLLGVQELHMGELEFALSVCQYPAIAWEEEEVCSLDFLSPHHPS